MHSTLQIIIAQIWPGKPTFTEKDIPSQAGKVFIVTGGNAGLGFELVKILFQRGAKVCILTRSESKAKAAIETIKSGTPIPITGADIKFIYLDLAYLLKHLLLSQLIYAAKIAPPNSVRIVFSGSPIIESHSPIGGIGIKQLTSPGSDMSFHYAMSKAGNWFLAFEFAKILGKEGIVSLVQNPGNLKTVI
jgi:NAD(P)-dependent dehydrogenase (short-subunit alcohol dehydrogenase family)